jgi:hypothetical protein
MSSNGNEKSTRVSKEKMCKIILILLTIFGLCDCAKFNCALTTIDYRIVKNSYKAIIFFKLTSIGEENLWPLEIDENYEVELAWFQTEIILENAYINFISKTNT